MHSLLLCSSDSLGYAFIFSLYLCVLGGSIVLACTAVVSLIPAGQFRIRRSSAILPYSRRVCVRTVALLVFAAVFCGVKVANG